MKNFYFPMLTAAMILVLGSCSKKDKTEPPPTHTKLAVRISHDVNQENTPAIQMKIDVSYLENGTSKVETAYTNLQGFAYLNLPVKTIADIKVSTPLGLLIYDWKIGPFEVKDTTKNLLLPVNQFSIEERKPDQFLSLRIGGVNYIITDITDEMGSGASSPAPNKYYYASRMGEYFKFQMWGPKEGRWQTELYATRFNWFKASLPAQDIVDDGQYLTGNFTMAMDHFEWPWNDKLPDNKIQVKFRFKK
ncbi:hypothetical protein HHL16_24400 [Pseudoflavitalea sp. G-6-1-2]|uniref:hypothetical protein n=1 Tax=Pseudoflavitalea sp. G-6-1-2 TaxID=2728841 RepID=UPI00146C82F8|nr:hypothetical protein [Pseudoflavitalea sp. G-6-1-2]NML24041.1 hypothetical protein [Pseudoflavitalea sp. G-6-1-2]